MRISSDRWMNNAQSQLEIARLLFAEEYYAVSITRAYFAMLYAGQSMLTSRGLETRRHRGLHDTLYKRFSPDPLPSELLSVLARMATYRNRCDYDLWRPSRDKNRTCLSDARRFVEVINEVK